MIVHASPFPRIDLPRQSISDRVFGGFAGREDQPVLIDGAGGGIWTGRQVVDAVQRLAGGLTARGLAPGRVVALMAPNLPEYAVVFHGVAWAGGTISTVNPSYTAEELRFQLTDSHAELLVTVPAFAATAIEGAKGTAVREIAVIGDPIEGTTRFESLLGAPMAQAAPVDLDRHPLVMPYSSGTTGLPKGVRLSHANLVANVSQILAIDPVRPGERTLAVLPFFHIYGMTVLMSYILAGGGALVTLPRFDLEAVLRLTQQHRMRRLFVVPPIVLALARHPMVGQFDLSGLEQVFSGAAPLDADLEEACHARLGCEMVQGYGMTEMSPVSHYTPPGRHSPGAAGLAVPNTACRIVDPETGEDGEVGAVGELWVQGPQVMLGYLNNSEATAATIRDGWIRTGDLGRIDESGHLFIVDRLKELIKVKGFQVAPAELEALLLTHPGVADAAVIGRPDPEAGEVPVAYVVPAPGASPDAEALRRFVDDHVAHYKRLDAVVFVDAIPKSASGKILRRLLRDAAMAPA